MTLWLLAALAVASPPPDRVVVRSHAPLSATALDALAQRTGHSLRPLFPKVPRKAPDRFTELGLDRVYVLDVPPGQGKSVAADLARDPGVEQARVDGRGSGTGVPDDPVFRDQWAWKNTGQASGLAGADVGAVDGWEMTTGDADIVLAVLDTGLNLSDPDLEPNLWTNEGEVPDNGVDDDDNGFVDDVHGYDFVNLDGDPDDDNGHGSNVGGIAGAVGDNGIGVTGACWDCRLMVGKNLDSENWGYYSDWAASVIYAVDNGAHVINMSEGGDSPNNTLEDAVTYAWDAGVPVFASMMNNDHGEPAYPVAYATTIAVGATNAQDVRASPFTWGGGSNWGDHIELVAPGDRFFSTSDRDGDYGIYYSGTSQATPVATGLAGLMLSLDPDLEPADIRELLHDTAADEVGDGEDTPGWDPFYGHGRLDFAATLEAVGGERPGGCGCSASPGMGWWALLGALPWLRRRR